MQITGDAISEAAGGVALLNELGEQFPDLRQVWCDLGVLPLGEASAKASPTMPRSWASLPR
ncbi:hypothetical protein [Kineococcus sp. SYSU DK005]|uniref:hypothetical protein n=1 Tax=Kineococcus sp. SYSU DK005 TaxID=3383126 RepID=UPI003D7DB95F